MFPAPAAAHLPLSSRADRAVARSACRSVRGTSATPRSTRCVTDQTTEFRAHRDELHRDEGQRVRRGGRHRPCQSPAGTGVRQLGHSPIVARPELLPFPASCPATTCCVTAREVPSGSLSRWSRGRWRTGGDAEPGSGPRYAGEPFSTADWPTSLFARRDDAGDVGLLVCSHRNAFRSDDRRSQVSGVDCPSKPRAD